MPTTESLTEASVTDPFRSSSTQTEPANKHANPPSLHMPAPDPCPLLSEHDLNAIQQIVVANLETGRAHRVMGKMCEAEPDHSPVVGEDEVSQVPTGHEIQWRSYLQRVTDTYLLEHSRIEALTSHCAEEWLALRAKLVAFARRVLLHKGCCGQYAQEMAEEIAQQTCERICVSIYPYDVPFDYWVCTILKNLIHFTLTRSQDILDRQPYMKSLDDLEMPEQTDGASLVCPHCQPDPYVGVQMSETMTYLLDMVEQLHSGGRRMVVVYTYIDGMTDDEIAEAMGRKKAVIQTLRHRAVHQLRTMIAEE